MLQMIVMEVLTWLTNSSSTNRNPNLLIKMKNDRRKYEYEASACVQYCILWQYDKSMSILL